MVVVDGRALVALVDVRPVLDGSGPPIVETRELGADDWVVIPAGVAHGFLALEPLQLLYLVTNEYDGSDELGFAWDDPPSRSPGRRPPGAPAAGRSCPRAIAANPPLAEPGGPPARSRRLSSTPGPHRSARLPTRPSPMGLGAPGPSRD